MKIVITVSQISQGGGLSKYVVTLADILTRDAANEVWVITTHPSTENKEFEALCSGRAVRYIALGDKGKVARYAALVRSIRTIGPDVLICNYNAPTQYVLSLLPRKTRVVHILHNNTDDFYRVGAINASYVDGWIAPTPAVAEYFNAYTGGGYRARVSVIPHGVARPVQVCTRTAGRCVELVYVGVLYEHKGVKILPDIIKRLYAKGLDFHFTVIGEGILHDELTARLAKEISDGVVEFTGRIPGEEVYGRLAGADVFVYPTHIDSFGLVIAEAMINHTVPVVTRLAGITDTIVEEGKSGYLLEQDDVDGFVNRIEALASDRALLSEMACESERRALDMFSNEVMQHNYLDYLNNLIK